MGKSSFEIIDTMFHCFSEITLVTSMFLGKQISEITDWFFQTEQVNKVWQNQSVGKLLIVSDKKSENQLTYFFQTAIHHVFCRHTFKGRYYGFERKQVKKITDGAQLGPKVVHFAPSFTF